MRVKVVPVGRLLPTSDLDSTCQGTKCHAGTFGAPLHRRNGQVDRITHRRLPGRACIAATQRPGARQWSGGASPDPISALTKAARRLHARAPSAVFGRLHRAGLACG
jgi:hypothetical protein